MPQRATGGYECRCAHRRRIEVVANGPSLWNGAQLAVDAAIVSLVTRRAEAQLDADVRPGQAVDAAARRKRQQTCPELARTRRSRAWWSSRLVAALEPRPPASSASWPGTAPTAPQLHSDRRR